MASTDLFRSMIAYWKEFDLQKLQEELDRAASVLAVQCEESDVSRQILLQKSREFKRNCSEEVQKATAPLLKCFQTEIDGLLRRSKLAESAFLAVYKKLIQMPDMMPVLVAADQLQSEVGRLQGCFTESLQQTNESANHRNKRRHCTERKKKKDRNDLTCGLVRTDHKDSSVQNISHLPTLPQNRLGTQVGAELKVLIDGPSGDGTGMASGNLLQNSGDICHDVESVRFSEDANPNSSSTIDDCAVLSSGVDVQCQEDQQVIQTHQENTVVVLRHEDDLSEQHDTVSPDTCDVMTEPHEDKLSSNAEVVVSNSTAGDIGVEKNSLTSDICPTQNDNDDLERNSDVTLGVGESRCEMPDDYRWIKDSQSDDGKALNDHMIHDSASQNDTVRRRSFPGDSNVQEDTVSVGDDGTALHGTEPDCERSILSDLHADGLQVEDNVHQEHAVRMLADESSSQGQQGTQLEHKMDFCEKWQDPARQSDKETDLSINNLSKMEDLASQIGHEIVTSFHNSNSDSTHFPQPRLWHPDDTVTKLEDCSFVPPAAHLYQHTPSYSTNLSASHIDMAPEIMKVEGGDETGSTPLDTLEVARHVREILSFHNLGQRLFARYVLGLSQGTVSELLSKPKHWEKLTEKGRESYRKMHQWASSEHNIQMLKSFSSPKCNVSSSSPSASSGRGVDTVAEERIAQILSEAQAAMQLKQETTTTTTTEQLHQNGLLESRMPETYSRPTVNQAEQDRAPPRKSKANRKTSSATSSVRNEALKNRKVESEHLTREIVARIYQEQLEKLAQVAEASGNVVELLTYRQELARLSQGWARRPVKPDDGLKEDKENRDEAVERPKKFGNDGLERLPEIKVDVDQPQDLSVNGSSEMLRPTIQEASAFPSVKVGFSSSPTATPVSGLLSPLQRMQSIANSLMLQSPSSSSQALQPARVVLPPISQEQFDLYANISTDELVKRVKDVLSQYSISQRLFGEFVLGLSQGSVSDLLARPKPWHLLTQKGREPFIRMQMFVDDSEAVQRLVASQYRVPPEKLLHSSSSSQLDDRSVGLANENSVEVSDFPAKTASRSSTPFHSPTTSFSACDAIQPRSEALSCTIFSSVSSSPSRSEGTPSTFDKSLTTGVGFPSMGVAMVPSVLSLFGATFLPSNQFGPLMNVDLHRLYGPSVGAGSSTVPPTQMPDVGSAAELDTQTITARVKEVLQLNNLGQKLFGEAVLELSQGSVSELLSKPKPWHMLSLKGREPFVKMQIWLGDPLGVQKLHAYQTHMAGRKRKSSCEGSSNEKSGSQKKPRLFFSEEQKEALRAAYQRDPYPNQLAIEQLASSLDIGVKTVINWFHNHRMRAKQHQTCNSPTSTTAGSPSCSALSRVKAEACEDVLENATQWASYHPDESMTHFPLRSKCDSASPSCDRRVERRSLSDAPAKALSSPNAKSASTESKRHELNKRKRARPHRLYSGTSAAADEIQVTGEFRAVHDAGEFRASADVAIDLSMGRSSESMQMAASTENHSVREAGNQCKTLNDRGTTLQKPVPTKDSFQNAVKHESAEDWNGNHRIKNIEKLQQNLLLAPSAEWEF